MKEEDSWGEGFIDYLLNIMLESDYLYFSAGKGKISLYAALVASILKILDSNDKANDKAPFARDYETDRSSYNKDKVKDFIHFISLAYISYSEELEENYPSEKISRKFLKAFMNKDDLYLCGDLDLHGIVRPQEKLVFHPYMIPKIIPPWFRVTPYGIRALNKKTRIDLGSGSGFLEVLPFSCIKNVRSTALLANLSMRKIEYIDPEDCLGRALSEIYVPYSYPIVPGSYFPAETVLRRLDSYVYVSFLRNLCVPLLKLFLWFYKYTLLYFKKDSLINKEFTEYNPYHYPNKALSATKGDTPPLNYYQIDYRKPVPNEIRNIGNSETCYSYRLPDKPSVLVYNGFYEGGHESVRKLLEFKWSCIVSEATKTCLTNIHVLEEELSKRSNLQEEEVNYGL